MRRVLVVAISLLVAAPARGDAPSDGGSGEAYPWKRRAAAYESLESRFKPPAGFTRVAAAPGSYAHWLRRLPLLPVGSPVKSYRGRVIVAPGDSRLAAVVDLDLSKRDRQQCADTIMRLRGEYLHARGKGDQARFRWSGGERFSYKQWRKGIRPVKEGDRWRGFANKARPCRGRPCMRRYLEFLFAWTGTMHLQQEPRVKDPARVRAGDFLIQGGSPGHTVVLLDLARDAHGEVRALIGQGFMPAQDLHVMRAATATASADAAGGSPWFKLDFKADGVKTPFWRKFAWSDLRRFSF